MLTVLIFQALDSRQSARNGLHIGCEASAAEVGRFASAQRFVSAHIARRFFRDGNRDSSRLTSVPTQYSAEQPRRALHSRAAAL